MSVLRGSTPPSPSPDSALRLPAARRISTPASARLSTITEGPQQQGAPSIPSRNPARGGTSWNSTSTIWSTRRPMRWSSSTQQAAPPAYEWVPEPVEGDGNEPVEGEKLARLRRGQPEPKKRGGWVRVILIVLVLVVILAIALGVGLGIGLRKKHKNTGGGSSNQPTTTPITQRFPLGQYSMVTVLNSAPTNCTANPATWLCYPNAIYDPADPMSISSLTIFNLIITNTSSTYATNSTTGATAEFGIPANLTISASNNPFSVSFTNQSLTYISSSSNSSSPRLTWTFNMVKPVIPSAAITSDNAVSECFYNSTTFTGTLYLNAPRAYPPNSESGALGQFDQWPSAVEIVQKASGGQNVPNCYETVGGVVGTRITTGLDPQSESEECMCDYRNFF